MSLLILAGGFLLATGTALLLSPGMVKLAVAQRWVDAPDGKRKLHAGPVPNIGGLAIAGGFLVGMTYFAAMAGHLAFPVLLPPLFFWIGGTVILVAGFYDDVYGLRFNHKFLVQIIVAYLLLIAGYRIDLSFLPFVEGDAFQAAIYSIPLTVIWVVGIINAVNLLDGLDGLAAGVSLIAFGSLGIVFGVKGELGTLVIMLAIAGALSGFLVHNFNPARIFMGDCGSMLLGYLLAVYSMGGDGRPQPLALLIPVVALGVPVLDTGLSIVRRLIERRPIFGADGDHIHHRLLRRGTHRGAVLTLYVVSVAFGAMAVILAVTPMHHWTLLLGTFLSVLVFWLRRLGYIRIRHSLQTIRERYFGYVPVEPPALPPAVNGRKGNAARETVHLDHEDERLVEVGP